MILQPPTKDKNMTATKTKKTKLIVKEKVFSDLISEYKKLAESKKDIDLVMKNLEEKITAEMEKENLKDIEIENVGTAEFVTTGGSITWSQDVLISLFKSENDSADFVAKICKLTPRESIAKNENFDISSAKKVGKFTDKLKIS